MYGYTFIIYTSAPPAWAKLSGPLLHAQQVRPVLATAGAARPRNSGTIVILLLFSRRRLFPYSQNSTNETNQGILVVFHHFTSFDFCTQTRRRIGLWSEQNSKTYNMVEHYSSQ